MRVLSLDRAAPVERPGLLRDAFAAYPVPLALRLSRAGDIHAEFDRADTAFGVVEGFHVEGRPESSTGLPVHETARCPILSPCIWRAPVTLEMTRLLVSTVLGDETRARASGALTLGERIMLFIDLHLDDPELSATVIARAHAISVRYLYVVLRQQQVSLGDHIRARRIAHARRLLAMPATARMPLVEVAQRCGFADYSSFARTFRAIVGMSPRGFRENVGTAVHESPDSVHSMPTTGGGRHV